MSHMNALVTPGGRPRMVLRNFHDGVPKAHVATGFWVFRPTVATWVARYLADGEFELVDRFSAPHRSHNRATMAAVELIESLRRERK